MVLAGMGGTVMPEFLPLLPGIATRSLVKPEIAPTPELRTWYGHRPDKWPEFRRRYRAELRGNQAAVESLRALCAGQQVTFVFAAKDEERNSAIVLKELLLAG